MMLATWQSYVAAYAMSATRAAPHRPRTKGMCCLSAKTNAEGTPHPNPRLPSYRLTHPTHPTPRLSPRVSQAGLGRQPLQSAAASSRGWEVRALCWHAAPALTPRRLHLPATGTPPRLQPPRPPPPPPHLRREAVRRDAQRGEHCHGVRGSQQSRALLHGLDHVGGAVGAAGRQHAGAQRGDQLLLQQGGGNLRGNPRTGSR